MDGWHIDRDERAVTLSRRRPVVWDVAVERLLPGQGGGRARLAHMVRQDLWRALRRQRGFAPVVTVSRAPGGLAVRAGGRVDAPHDRRVLEARIADVLDLPSNRARWLRSASNCVQVTNGTRRCEPHATEYGQAGEAAP